ncbi:MAG: hypothetical protein V1729_05270 [Candidatus Woesearchaeota archaeon]
MTAQDRWGYEYVYQNGTVSDAPLKGKRALIEYHYSENEGWSFMRRGPEKSMRISFAQGMTCERLEQILEETEMNETASMLIKKMIKKGKVESGSYLVD